VRIEPCGEFRDSVDGMQLIQRVKKQIENTADKKGTQAAAVKRLPSKTQAAGKKPGEYDESPFAALPLLRDTPPNERPDLLRKKLRALSVPYDFALNPSPAEMEAKRQTLLEIVDYANNTRHCFIDGIVQDVVDMVSANIFRTLSPTANRRGGEEQEEDATMEPRWPHLQIVYEFFLRFVVSHEVDPKIAKKCIDHVFVTRLLDLFDSEDPRERDYLKTTLHRIYGKIMALRLFIRKAAQNRFFNVIYNGEHHNGLPELLEILGSIINGFALPLKEEHKTFLSKSLLPLQKVRYQNVYHAQLSYCMMQYIEKDQSLSVVILQGLLRYWPITDSSKQVLFLNQIEEILEVIMQRDFDLIKIPLFRRLEQCIRSSHFQVAERTLLLWNNDEIVKLVNDNRQDLFPLIISAIYCNTNAGSKTHWNASVCTLTYNVLKLLMEADTKFFDDVSTKERFDAARGGEVEENRQKRWDSLTESFDANAPQALKALWPRPARAEA
jgi:serine/threonine-protein phosphatase 2A regulatory subunit B'